MYNIDVTYLCITSPVLENNDMDSETHSVMIQKFGLHSIKSTDSKKDNWWVYKGCLINV